MYILSFFIIGPSQIYISISVYVFDIGQYENCLVLVNKQLSVKFIDELYLNLSQ